MLKIVVGSLASALVAAGLLVGCGDDPQSTARAKSKAIAACQDHVRVKLQNPESVRFVPYRVDVAASGDGWSVTGWAGSRDRFGMWVESRYECRTNANSVVASAVVQPS